MNYSGVRSWRVRESIHKTNSRLSVLGVADVEGGLMQHLLRRRQQIGQVELVGAVAPYLSLPQVFAGRRVIHWIDNTSALAALAKGYSGVPDSARLIHMFHAWAAAAGAAVWFEYVPTDANPADEPSRRLELAGMGWRPVPGVVSQPVACAQPPLQRLSAVDGWAREAALARERAQARSMHVRPACGLV